MDCDKGIDHNDLYAVVCTYTYTKWCGMTWHGGNLLPGFAQPVARRIPSYADIIPVVHVQ